jgi:hypothetical protein
MLSRRISSLSRIGSMVDMGGMVSKSELEEKKNK